MPRALDDIRAELERRLDEPEKRESDGPRSKGRSTLVPVLISALLGGGAGAGTGAVAANAIWADQAIRERLELPRIQAEQIRALEERVRRLERDR